MSAFTDLVEKFINEPERITPGDCGRLLGFLGYSQKKNPGSERIYHKKGCSAINVPTPKHGRFVNPIYVKRIIRLLELEDYLEGGDRKKTD